MDEADLNGDGVLDAIEAAEFLVVDGKLHIQARKIFSCKNTSISLHILTLFCFNFYKTHKFNLKFITHIT